MATTYTLEYILQDLDETKPYQSFRATLEDITYELTLQWNERNQFWTCAIGEVGDDPIVKWKITANSDPLQVYGYNSALPQGAMLVYSLYTPRNRVAIDSIGESKMHWFTYYSKTTT